MTTFQSKVRDLAVDIMTTYRDDIKKKIEERGLVLTGSLVNSVEYRIVKTPFGFSGQIWLNDYGLVWETGVPRNKIGQFLGSRANAIAELSDYMRKRGADNPRSAAEALIKVWYREGAPTRASRKFSRAPGGERTRFIARSVKQNQKDIEKKLENQIGEIVLATVTQTARNTFRSFIK